MAISAEVNADQAEFWNSNTGAQWVQEQEVLDTLFAGVLEHLLERADLLPGQSVLDIGCGTGASVLAACERVGPEGAVEGLDISRRMLERAGQRAEAAGHAQARLINADAQVHTFEPQTFDRVVSRFGVMFFEDTVSAFANIARAVKPSGRMTFASWGAMQDNPWFSVPRAAAIERLGTVAPADPNAPGPMAFQDTERVLGLFAKAGLRDANFEVVNVPLRPPGIVEEVAEIASSVGPASRILREKGGTAEDAQAIAQIVALEYAQYATPEGVRIPTQLNFYSAFVP